MTVKNILKVDTDISHFPSGTEYTFIIKNMEFVLYKNTNSIFMNEYGVYTYSIFHRFMYLNRLKSVTHLEDKL